MIAVRKPHQRNSSRCYFYYLRQVACNLLAPKGKRLNYKCPGRFPEGLPEACPVIFNSAAVPEGPGRFPEGLPEACFMICVFAAVPEGPGRFPEGLPEACSKLFVFPSSGRFRKVPGRLAGRVQDVVGCVVAQQVGPVGTSWSPVLAVGHLPSMAAPLPARCRADNKIIDSTIYIYRYTYIYIYIYINL